MIKAYYHRWTQAPYYYQVNVLCNGVQLDGRFCETWEEVIAFCKYHKVEALIKR